MEFVLFDWLGDGALPVFDYRGPFWYATCERQGGREGWRWEAAPGRARLILTLSESKLDEFLAFLDQPMPEGRTLLISIRSSYTLDNETFVCLGLGLADGDFGGVPTAELPPLREALDMVLGLRDRDERPEEPWLVPLWDRIQAGKARMREWEAECAVRREQEAQAKERARRLLVGCLDEEQAKELAEHGSFRVRASDGFVYLITDRHHLSVWRLDAEGKKTHNVCIVVDEVVPIYDQMLAQKLLLEADLEAFLRTAIIRAVGADGRLIAEPVDLVGA